jgi:integrase
VKVAKRCDCQGSCSHAYHYAFKYKGRLHRGSTQTANSVLAQRCADKARRDVIEGRIGIATWTAPTLDQHIATYIEEQRGEFPRTAGRDARVLTGFAAIVGNKRIDQITTWDITRWRSARVKDVARSTVERDEHAIRGCFSHAELMYKKQKFVSPCADLPPWKPDEKTRRALSLDEIARALQQLPAHLALICRVTLECLPRLSEVLGLRRVDLGPDRISFRRKGGKVATIQASPALVIDLRALPGKEYVFGDPTEDERKDLVAWLLARQAATSVAFTRAFRAIGLHGVSHHVMRHTGVTLMLERGVHARVIQQLAGWSTLRMLEKYGHVRDEAQQKAVAGNAAVVAAAQTTPIESGVPSGSRTRVSGLKGRRPRPLDDGDRDQEGIT